MANLLKHKMFIWSFKWQAPLENVFHLHLRFLLGFSYKCTAPKSILMISILVINIILIHKIACRHTGKIRTSDKYEYKVYKIKSF